MERNLSSAGIAEQFMGSWTSTVFRNRCAAQIESVRMECRPKVDSDDMVEKFLTQKTSKELEEFIFCQSKTREDYISLVADIVMMFRQTRNRPDSN